MLVTINWEHVEEYVKKNKNAVTETQLDKVNRIVDENTGEVFYRVESSKHDKNGKEYTVTYDEKGFHCTCECGQDDFKSVRNPSGVDWHVRAAVKREMEFQAEERERERREQEAREAKRKQQEQERQAEQPQEETPKFPEWYNPSNETSFYHGTRAHLLITGDKEADDATYTRVMLAPGQATSGPEVRRDMYHYQQNRPFTLM